MTVTPVLADQLEARRSAREDALPFLRRHRVDPRRGPRRRRCRLPPPARPAAKAEARPLHQGARSSDRSAGATHCAPFRTPHAAGGSRWSPRPLPTPCCRSSRPARGPAPPDRCRTSAPTARRFGGEGDGFWLPECAYVPGLGSAARRAGRSPTPASTRARPGRSPTGPPWRRCGLSRRPGRASRSTGPRVEPGLVPARGIPQTPPSLEYHRHLAENGTRLWSVVGRSHMTPRRRARRPRGETPDPSWPRWPGEVRRHRGTSGAGRGLCVFAIDTELLGHWWAEGPTWLRGGDRRRRGEGVRLLTPPGGARRASEPRKAARCTRRAGGRGRTLLTWDSPAVSDLVWAARRLGAAPAQGALGRPAARGRRPGRARSCSPCRRATGHSSTAGERPATTPSSAPPRTRNRPSRP